MTNKEFFLSTLKEEAPQFRTVIDSVPENKYEYKVHDRSRSAGNLAAQLGLQWKAVSGIVNEGIPAFNPHEMENQSKKNILEQFDEGIQQLVQDIENLSDEEWENGLSGWGEEKHDKKFHMSWGFLFDAIHHRGQLSSYIRAMDEKVPSIYGPSADSE